MNLALFPDTPHTNTMNKKQKLAKKKHRKTAGKKVSGRYR